MNTTRVATPNDPKLSDRGVRRGTCMVGGKAAAEAAGVTAAPVRCSAWLGVAVISEIAVRCGLKLRPNYRIENRTGVENASLEEARTDSSLTVVWAAAGNGFGRVGVAKEVGKLSSRIQNRIVMFLPSGV